MIVVLVVLLPAKERGAEWSPLGTGRVAPSIAGYGHFS